jgi:hypothetical protein
MDLICYFLLGTKSRRLMKKRSSRWGQKYHYQPREQLVKRLAFELKTTESYIREQLAKERLFILQTVYGDEITNADV